MGPAIDSHDLADGEPEVDYEFDALDDDDWLAPFLRLETVSLDEQRRLAFEIEAGVLAQGVLDGDIERLRATDDELQLLVERGNEALTYMLEANLKLVVHWARRYSRGEYERWSELVQDGFFGLWRAILGWDSLRGYTFSTYATWHIRQQISRGLQQGNASPVIHIPVHIQDEWTSSDRHGTELSELARHARQLVKSLLSWEVLKELELELIDRTIDEADDVEERLDVDKLCAIALTKMSDRMQEVLFRRFGFGPNGPQTLEEIAGPMGVTRERVRQIESKALALARQNLVTQNPGYWDDIRMHLPNVDDVDLASLVQQAIEHKCLSIRAIQTDLDVDKSTARAVYRVLAEAMAHLHVLATTST